jgi:hypothetical protein
MWLKLNKHGGQCCLVHFEQANETSSVPHPSCSARFREQSRSHAAHHVRAGAIVQDGSSTCLQRGSQPGCCSSLAVRSGHDDGTFTQLGCQQPDGARLDAKANQARQTRATTTEDPAQRRRAAAGNNGRRQSKRPAWLA